MADRVFLDTSFVIALLNEKDQYHEKYADKKWGLVDCISFVVMREAGLSEVLTFDQDFEQAGFMVLSH